MFKSLSSSMVTLLVLLAAALAYFVAFPDDSQAVTAPLATFLNVSNSISPWLYMVVAVGLVAWAIVRTWGRERSA